MSRVLVCIPIKPALNPELKAKCHAAADRLPAANPAHELVVCYDERAIPKLPGDCRPWSRVTRARNAMLADIDLLAWDYLLWIDADVVDYPADLPSRLIAANPGGVTAPMVMVEENADRFYDTAAFIQQGADHIEPTNRAMISGRNLAHDAPYWSPATRGIRVPMDCVGTITMVPTWIYRQGVRYIDHPAFTDHYPICKACRDAGQKVIACRDLVAFHADLPRYGEQWH